MATDDQSNQQPSPFRVAIATKRNASERGLFEQHFPLSQVPSMKRYMAATATAIFAVTTYAAAALAQSGPPPANPNAHTPAIASPSTTNADAPAAGANSFTEAQAKSRIEAAGFSNVSALMKDKDGLWRGKASRGGTTSDVALDFQGNVVTK
jgi:hypothetical protein